MEFAAAHVKVQAVDLEPGFKPAHHGAFLKGALCLPEENEFHPEIFGHIPDGEFPVQEKTVIPGRGDFSGDEPHIGELAGVKKIRGAQVVVPFGDAMSRKEGQRPLSGI